jgi:hypothetical protein
MQKLRFLLLAMGVFFFIPAFSQTNDTLTITLKLKQVNAYLIYNTNGSPGDLDLMWAIRFDTDNNTNTGIDGYDLEMSLTHYKDAAGSRLGNIIQATKHSFWKLTSGGGRTEIDTLIAKMNRNDTSIIIKGLKTFPDLDKVKEGNRWMAITYESKSTGYYADTVMGAIVPNMLKDDVGECSMSTADIVSVQIANAAKGSSVRNIHLDNQLVNIYPQPIVEYATIDIPSSISKPINFTLFNTQGTLVKQIRNQKQGDIRFEREALPGGMYFFNISTNDGQIICNGKISIAGR